MWAKARGRAPHLGIHRAPGWILSQLTPTSDTIVESHYQWENFPLSPLVVTFINLRRFCPMMDLSRIFVSRTAHEFPGLVGGPIGWMSLRCVSQSIASLCPHPRKETPTVYRLSERAVAPSPSLTLPATSVTGH